MRDRAPRLGPYIDEAGLLLVATAPDPGNPGAELRLYDVRKETKVLLAVKATGCTPGTYVVRRQREQEGRRARLVAD